MKTGTFVAMILLILVSVGHLLRLFTGTSFIIGDYKCASVDEWGGGNCNCNVGHSYLARAQETTD